MLFLFSRGFFQKLNGRETGLGRLSHGKVKERRLPMRELVSYSFFSGSPWAKGMATSGYFR